jgi:hypothetical protein
MRSFPHTAGSVRPHAAGATAPAALATPGGGTSNRAPGRTVEDDLLDCERPAEIVEGIGVVEARHVEVTLGEATQRQSDRRSVDAGVPVRHD